MPDVTDAPAAKAKAKPKPKVTPLRPLEDLARQLDEPPIAAAPGGDGGAPPPPPPEPDAMGPAEPGGRPSRDRPRGEIWRGCPVKPLGVNGATYYYLDIHGQLRAIAKHDAQSILMLFGHHIPKLCHHFPVWTKGDMDGPMMRKPDRFDQTSAAMVMIAACSEHSLFDPENAVRGVGAWTDDDGQLIYHMGDRLSIAGVDGEPTTHQGRIYPACPAIPHPAAPAKGTDPAAGVLDVLQTWTWRRPDIDPMILLGFVAAQAMGGALDWRPTGWVTGGPGTGKSALQRALLLLAGGEKGLIQSTDATARGIASLLGQSTLPVALDELEPGDKDSAKERDIIQTARVASSGGRWARGSSDQKGSTGQLRSTFLFSSILVPGVLKSQDLQRIVLLNLDPFPEGSTPPSMRAETWRKRGAELRHLLITRWPSWRARLDLWREAFGAHAIEGRNADNWATLMALAQMLRAEALPTAEELAGWTAKVARHIKADLGDLGSDADEVLVHLLTQTLDKHMRGEQWTVGQWVMVAAGSPAAPPGLLGDFAQGLEGQTARAKRANEVLARACIKVVSDGKRPPTLFVGNAPVQPLKELFRDSPWAGGAWKQSLERVKGATLPKTGRTLAGVATRGVEVPLASIPGLMMAEDAPGIARTQAAPAASPAPDGMEDFA